MQLTRDGHAVVLHDPTVDRTTNGQGRIRDMSLAEVRRLSAGFPVRFGAAYAGERLPTLTEALHFVRERARALVEIKSDSVTADAEGGIEAVTVQEVRRRPGEDVALISFDRRARCAARSSRRDRARPSLPARPDRRLPGRSAGGRLRADHAPQEPAHGRPRERARERD